MVPRISTCGRWFGLGDRVDELRRAVWRRAAGFAYPEDLPDIAASALAQGVDSPSLRVLAGLGRRDDTAEILTLYEAALAESGIEVPGSEQAARWWLGELAGALVVGRMTVGDAVEQIVPPEAWMSEDEFSFANLGYYRQDLVDIDSAEQVRDTEDAIRPTTLGL